jgi:H+/Cl- antiporter ClcA
VWVEAIGPPVGLALAAAALHWLAGGAGPATADEYIRAVVDPEGRFDLRPVLGRLVASMATLGGGAAMGFEGFRALLGRPPIRYLTEWRLNLASGLLRTTTLGVAEIGAKVGYTSEEAFSRAFKRSLGQAPAHWRAI